MSKFYMVVPIMLERTCPSCNQRFMAKKLDLARGKSKFCSDKCRKHHQKINNKPSPTQKARLKKDEVELRKAEERDASFAEYDALCEREDLVVKPRKRTNNR